MTETGSKILCIDDTQSNLTLFEALLEPEGYAVTLVASGEEALQEVEKNLPDLILLDVMLPGMSGFEVLKKLRANERTRLIPVVMITGLQDRDNRVKGIESGCDDFIAKPFGAIELLARVKSLIRIGYYRRELDEKEKFETILNSMTEGVVVCDPNWKTIEVNPAALKYLNMPAEEGAELLDFLYHNFTVSISREAITDTREIHKAFDIIRQESDQFERFYLEASMDILKNPAGEISSILITLRDVTEQRREDSLKRDFLALISHKLRTPLVSLIGGVDLLKDKAIGDLSERQQKAVDILSRSANRVHRLFDRLLTFIMMSKESMEKDEGVIELLEHIERFFEKLP
ncbi:MAG: response regulator, partial [bacterium]